MGLSVVFSRVSLLFQYPNIHQNSTSLTSQKLLRETKVEVYKGTFMSVVAAQGSNIHTNLAIFPILFLWEVLRAQVEVYTGTFTAQVVLKGQNISVNPLISVL